MEHPSSRARTSVGVHPGQSGSEIASGPKPAHQKKWKRIIEAKTFAPGDLPLSGGGGGACPGKPPKNPPGLDVAKPMHGTPEGSLYPVLGLEVQWEPPCPARHVDSLPRPDTEPARVTSCERCHPGR